MSFSFFLQKKFFFIFFALFFLVLATTLLYLLSQKNKYPVGTTPDPLPTPTPIEIPTYPTTITSQLPATKVYVLQKTTIGLTTASEVEKIVGLQKKEILPNGENQYFFPSELPARPNLVRADKNGVVFFERELVPSDPSSPGYVKTSQYANNYGQPEKTIRGSFYYGWAITAYVYANKGFALVGNPNTDEVFEIHIFSPTSVDEYVKNYGEDLNPGAQPPQEGLPQ